MSDGELLSGRLAEICGEENVVSDRSAMGDYSIDMADFQGAPLVVVRPGSEGEVARVVALANELKVPIVPRGAGSSLTGASVLEGAISVDMRRMDRVISVDTVNWHVRAQAGITLEDLGKSLRAHGFFFPPDPASSSICTLGGAIAEGSGGLRCVKYGTMKDWVVAVRVVLPNGKVANLGEPLSKNRAGYDLVHLIVGSEGTLGIVTEAWLKIIPVSEERSRRFLLQLDDWKSASDLISALRSEKIMPHIFEFLDRETVQAVNQKLGLDLEEAEATLIVDIGEESLSSAGEIFRRCGARRVTMAKDEEEAESFYQVRAMAYLAIRGLGSAVQVEDVCVPIERLGEYLAKVKEIAGRRGLRIPVNGHAGDGNVHPVILYDAGDEGSRRAAGAAFEDICRYAIAIGGSVSGEHGIGVQKARLMREQLVAHEGEEALRLMKEIKRLFDPNGIMNPGKYVEAA
jgi:glycolate oxidase